ncbi:MAG TPA: MarR family winged helix-turn-helix transcriptional regulator [Polyangia bacterium]|nr:MarR family winged helix-turn-helix transcriptional regulator [Polyangia bacterium]
MGTNTIVPGVIGGTALADPSTRAVLDGIRHIVRTLREASRAAERAVGLSAAQLFVMQRLASAGSLSVNELAERTLTHQSSVSVVVAKLAQRGLVERQRAASDARRLEVTLTAAGRAALSRAPAATQDRLIAALALLGRPARIRLAADLQMLLDAMGVDRRHAPMFFEAPASKRKKNQKTNLKNNPKQKAPRRV